MADLMTNIIKIYHMHTQTHLLTTSEWQYYRKKELHILCIIPFLKFDSNDTESWNDVRFNRSGSNLKS